jgi:hypothetical protein
LEITPQHCKVSKGDKVYIDDAELCYRECVVKESKDGQVICFDADYKIYKVTAEQVGGTPLTLTLCRPPAD